MHKIEAVFTLVRVHSAFEEYMRIERWVNGSICVYGSQYALLFS